MRKEMKSEDVRSPISSQISKMQFFFLLFSSLPCGNISQSDSFLPQDPTLASFAHTGKQKAHALIRVLLSDDGPGP